VEAIMNRERCFDVPAWHKTLWGEHAKATPEAARVGVVGDKKIAGFSDGYMPELHHRLYADNPAELPANKRSPAAAARARLHDLASELPEFSTLRKQTVRDPLWAGMATTVIGEAVAGTLPDRKPGDGDAPDADKANRILDGLRDLEEQGAASPEQVGKAAGEAFAAAEGVAEQASSAIDGSLLRQALRRAIGEAQEAIDEAQKAAVALGYGNESGTGAKVPPSVAIELARKVRGSEKLRKILELAGRLQATARAKRATRSEYARSEVVGVEQTNQIDRLLPSELGCLGSSLRTVDLLRRVTEGNALGYRVRGKEKTVKGPIIILVDHSGSMAENSKEEWSKAVALALLDAARAEKRPFGLVFYNTVVIRQEYFASVDAVDPSYLLDALSTSASGGTNFWEPCSTASGMIRGPLGKADIVHITDGVASSERSSEFMKQIEQAGAHVYGIVIQDRPEGLKPWCHEVTRIDDVSRDTAAVDLVFDNV
jgi:uncharacterized protein with von Willebrand factor type A (vWA) domain